MSSFFLCITRLMGLLSVSYTHLDVYKRQPQETANSGYVTSAPLCQLVEIYNKIGDKLFKRNVRYGLNEQLGVDRAIKETLRNSPQDF